MAYCSVLEHKYVYLGTCMLLLFSGYVPVCKYGTVQVIISVLFPWVFKLSIFSFLYIKSCVSSIADFVNK